MRRRRMEEIVRLILNLLTSVLSIYSLLIFIRIIISWFGSTAFGSIDSSKPASFLSRITDPYLDWWRRTLNLRFGVLDLSPIAAIAALSIVRSVVFRLSAAGMITIGNGHYSCFSLVCSGICFRLFCNCFYFADNCFCN